MCICVCVCMRTKFSNSMRKREKEIALMQKGHYFFFPFYSFGMGLCHCTNGNFRVLRGSAYIEFSEFILFDEALVSQDFVFLFFCKNSLFEIWRMKRLYV